MNARDSFGDWLIAATAPTWTFTALRHTGPALALGVPILPGGDTQHLLLWRGYYVHVAADWAGYCDCTDLFHPSELAARRCAAITAFERGDLTSFLPPSEVEL